MKKTLWLIVFMSILFSTFVSYGAPIDYLGGVHNEYEYEEIIFITGEPIKFKGTVNVRERYDEKRDTLTVTYDFRNLIPEDPSIDARINRRSITYVTEYTKDTSKGQSVGQTTVTRYNETMNIDGDRYQLEDYQFSRSDIIDNRPASNFYTGNVKGRKYYSINNNEGQVIVDITGGHVGYENFWGSTETQKTSQIITYPDGRQGVVNTQTSDSLTKRLVYSDNEVNLITFDGGYIRTTNRDLVSKYDYKLPNGEGKNTIGSESLSKAMSPKLERLVVPKFRDVNGHWAEEYIEKLYSLNVFDNTSTSFFIPEGPITREEYIKGVLRASNIEVEIPTNNRRTNRRGRGEEEVSPFADISVDDKSYPYIKAAHDLGIIKGRRVDLFRPKSALTMAEGVTMLIRALGFENRAPNPGYYTNFIDHRDIPSWAKDSVYVAKEIGILKGDRLNPNKPLTRAEASELLVRFLEFLEKDLQKDYRENIILY